MNAEKINGNVEIERNRQFFGQIGEKVLNLVRSFGAGERVLDSRNYLLTEHMTKDEKKNKFFRELYEEWDNCGVDMPRELGEYLELFVNDPNCWFGIHRSNAINGKNFENDAILKSIMKDGLMNHGDADSGSIRIDPAVDKTVVRCDDMLHAVINLKSAYKGSTGAVLVAIPSKYLDKEGNVKLGEGNHVYNHDKYGLSLIKPEFVLGFVQNLGEGSTLKFKSREELLAGENQEN